MKQKHIPYSFGNILLANKHQYYGEPEDLVGYLFSFCFGWL